MVNSDKDNKNLGLFAAISTVIFGITYGLFKAFKSARYIKFGEEGEKMVKVSCGLFQEGRTENEVFQVFYELAKKQFNRLLKSEEEEKIWTIVREAKRRFEENK